VPNVVRVDFHHDVGADFNVACRLNFRYAAASLSGANLTSLANQMEGWYEANFGALLNSEHKLVQIVCTDLNSSTGAQGTWSGSFSGTRTGLSMTAETCALVNYKIGRRYRGGKPRTYWPWGSSTDLATPQTWNGSFVSAVNSAITAFNTSAVAYSGPPDITEQVSISYYSGGTWVQNPVTGAYHFHPAVRPTPVIDSIVARSCNQMPGSQRRRMGR
jgi:hypothetical protein